MIGFVRDKWDRHVAPTLYKLYEYIKLTDGNIVNVLLLYMTPFFSILYALVDVLRNQNNEEFLQFWFDSCATMALTNASIAATLFVVTDNTEETRMCFDRRVFCVFLSLLIYFLCVTKFTKVSWCSVDICFCVFSWMLLLWVIVLLVNEHKRTKENLQKIMSQFVTDDERKKICATEKVSQADMNGEKWNIGGR